MSLSEKVFAEVEASFKDHCFVDLDEGVIPLLKNGFYGTVGEQLDEGAVSWDRKTELYVLGCVAGLGTLSAKEAREQDSIVTENILREAARILHPYWEKIVPYELPKEKPVKILCPYLTDKLRE